MLVLLYFISLLLFVNRTPGGEWRCSIAVESRQHSAMRCRHVHRLRCSTQVLLPAFGTLLSAHRLPRLQHARQECAGECEGPCPELPRQRFAPLPGHDVPASRQNWHLRYGVAQRLNRIPFSYFPITHHFVFWFHRTDCERHPALCNTCWSPAARPH